MFPNLSELISKFDKFDASIQHICAQLTELASGQREANDQVRQIGTAFTAEHGIFLDDPRHGIIRRSVLQPPMIWEGNVTAQTTIETIHPQARRLIFGGFYANLGMDPFGVRLICPGGESPEHTLPPGAAIPITSVVSRVVIIPRGGWSAHYQIYGR